MALDWFGRQAAKPYIEDFRNLLDSLTNGALSPEQLDSLIRQVMHNLYDSEGLELKSLVGATPPVSLTPRQKQIIQHQIDQLSPDIRDTVQKAFDRATNDRTIICPKCIG